MEKFKGTKGKWEAWLSGSSYYVANLKGKEYRDILNIDNIGNIDEVEANAQLIAAASELLSELQHVVKALETVSSFGATTPIINRAKSIINKALGKEE